MRRGRRHPERLAVGDAVDCWRVTAFEPDRLLRLEAEMRLPGRAWLEFEVTPDGAGSRIRQMAVFEPSGLAGLAYWYGAYALHAIVFGSMLRAIARDAVGASRIEAGAPGARESPCSCSRPDSRPRAHRAAACLRSLRAGSD